MNKKVGTKRTGSMTNEATRAPHKPLPSSSTRRTTDPSERAQLRQADELLRRIEQKGKALSADADRLLRRVS
jgi:hypothetical protein